MSNNDLMIDGGLVKIEAKLKELESAKPEAYAFKTNCRYNDTNIKALSLSGLALVVNSIGKELAGCDFAAQKLAENGLGEYYNTEFKQQLNDILDDVLYLMKKLSWAQKKKALEEKKTKLEAFYSEDKKSQMSVEALLADL